VHHGPVSHTASSLKAQGSVRLAVGVGRTLAALHCTALRRRRRRRVIIYYIIIIVICTVDCRSCD